jgi:hypothetical protein
VLGDRERLTKSLPRLQVARGTASVVWVNSARRNDDIPAYEKETTMDGCVAGK